MSEALLKDLGGKDFYVVSAGTDISNEVNPFAIEVLKELGLETKGLHPKKVDRFVGEEFDLVITVCDNAKQACPHFPGAKAMEHWSLEDPAAYQGTYHEKLTVFRETRDEIKRRIKELLLKGAAC